MSIPETQRNWSAFISPCAIVVDADCLRTIWREEGIRGLYKGLVPALFLTSHGAIQFAIYESFKKFALRYQVDSAEKNKQVHFYPEELQALFAPSCYVQLDLLTLLFVFSVLQHTQPAWVSALIGGSSKIIASTVTYPYQLVKSKLQQRDAVNAATQLTERRYTGTWDCVQKVWR